MFVFKKKILLILFFITLFIKLSTCFYLAHLSNCSTQETNHTILAQKSGDAPAYLDPIDNFIEKGSYFYGNGVNKTYFGRAPYYGSVYYVFRLFNPPDIAYDMVAIFQIIMESVSIIFLSLLSFKIIRNKFAFWITYSLMIMSLNLTVYSNYLVTESLSASFLIIFCYYYYTYLSSKSNKHIFLAGLFLGLATLLKPYFSLLYLPIGLLFLFDKPFSLPVIIKRTCLVSISLIILSVPYTLRNLISYHKFLPSAELYASSFYTKADFAYWDFLTSWGGSYIYWDKHSAGSYFEPKEGVHSDFVFPEYAISGGYEMKDIVKVREMYIRYQANHNLVLEDSVYNEFNRLRNIFIRQHSFRYHFISPLLIFKQYIFHSGSYFLPINKSFPCYKSYQWLIKLSQSFLYYFSLFIGFSGLFILFKRDKNTYMNLLIPLFLIILFPIVFKTAEARFFVVAYPFLIIGSSLIIFKLLLNLKLIVS